LKITSNKKALQRSALLPVAAKVRLFFYAAILFVNLAKELNEMATGL